MEYNKQYLYNAYNATSTGNENDELETYENWLERQLISRLKKIDEMEVKLNQSKKPWSFCETPQEKCTMNYCDDNGCQNRKRHLVNETYNSESIPNKQ
ncbi:hypothetical protein ABMY20_15210 [Tenacibaculum sp. SSH1-16]|uniref:hypothetical protein n=1 Tax=Tenacibaculum sp. SSH1-16 TaxID=3136667 RepID=UPI0032C3E6DB|nr:hypothetical protein BACY1_20670 [Tenacibaculum mesophilum]